MELDESAIIAIIYAKSAAKKLGLKCIDPEALMVGVLCSNPSVAISFLKNEFNLNVNAQKTVNKLVKTLKEKCNNITSDQDGFIPFSKHTQYIMEQSNQVLLNDKGRPCKCSGVAVTDLLTAFLGQNKFIKES